MHGVVRSRSGAAIEGATVVALEMRWQPTLSTRSGAWKLLLTPGPHTLVATAPGFAPSSVEIVVPSTTQVEFEMTPHLDALTGTVFDATGGVVEDAVVQVERVRPAGDWPFAYETVTDVEGRYAIAARPGEAVVSASHPDYTEGRVTLSLGRGPQTFDFRLMPAAVVSGTVIDSATAAPVSGATVDAGGKSVITDRDGRFRLGGLDPGKLRLVAHTPELVSHADVFITLSLAEHRENVVLMLEPAAMIHGQVLSTERGEPISHARIEVVAGPSVSRSTVGNTDGTFRLGGVVPGDYMLRVQADQRLERLVAVEVGFDTAPVTLYLEPGLWLRGRVQPPQEASIEAWPLHPQAGHTLEQRVTWRTTAAADQQGSFDVGPLPEGRVKLTAEAADGSRGHVTVSADVGTVVIELQAQHRLRGKIVNETDGRPLANARLELTLAPGAVPPAEASDDVVAAVISGPDGAFELAGLEAREYLLTVLDVTQQRLEVTSPREGRLQVRPHDTHELEVQVAGTRGSITGVVRPAKGTVQAWVQARPTHRVKRSVAVAEGFWLQQPVGELPAPVLTEADGRFEIHALPPGTYSLDVTAVDQSAFGSLNDVAVDSRVVVDLDAASAICGRLVRDGIPVQRFELRISGPMSSALLFASRDGRFCVDRLRPGMYHVRASAPNGSAEQDVELAPGDETAVSLEMLAHGSVRGRIVDQSKHGIGGVSVLALSETERTEATTTSKGEFSIELPPGRWWLVCPGYSFRRDLTVSEGADIDLGDLGVD